MSKEELQNNDEKNVSIDAGLTNAERELQADAKSDNKEVKRISYAGLITRRFFRQRSAVIGLIILGIMVLIAVFGPYATPFNYTDADFTAINMAPNAKHWFGTDGAGIDLYACVVHGLCNLDHYHFCNYWYCHCLCPRHSREDWYVAS